MIDYKVITVRVGDHETDRALARFRTAVLESLIQGWRLQQGCTLHAQAMIRELPEKKLE
jgi:hypothetical protein